MINLEKRNKIRNTRMKTVINNYPIKQVYEAFEKIGVELHTGNKHSGHGKQDPESGKYYIVQDKGMEYRLLVIAPDEVACSWNGGFNGSDIAGERFDVDV